MGRMQGESEIVEIAKRSVIIEHFALDKLFSTYYVFYVLMLMFLLLVRKEQQFYPYKLQCLPFSLGSIVLAANQEVIRNSWDVQKDTPLRKRTSRGSVDLCDSHSTRVR